MSRTDFWSRRKAAVQEEEARITPPVVTEAQAPDTRPDDEILADLGLPDPDSLGQGDDFKAFMQAAVPDHLRRRALRRLWVSNPVLANLDNLVDYAEDYTDAATVLPDMKTAYQVGKGMLRHIEELARQAEAEDAPEAMPTEPDETPEPDCAPVCDAPDTDAIALIPVEDAESLPVGDDTADPSPAPRHHMRFEFS